MAKLSDALKKQVEEALKNGTPLPEGVKVNFGDPEPYQTAADAPAPTTAADAPAPTANDDVPKATAKGKGK